MTVLASLYECIAEPMERVRRIFGDELSSDLHYVRDLCDHISQFRGKMLRPALVLLSGQACGGIGREHAGLGAVVEMVHMATLVHDDVLDDADVRRHVMTVNRMEGNEAAVLLGDYLISHAFYLCDSLNLSFASELIGSTTNTMCEGELMQVYHRGNYQLSQEEYFEIIGRKTASMTRTCCVLGAHYAGADGEVVSAMERYGYEVGMAFQIVDDVLDIIGQEERTGKTLGRDLDKGKLTLPVVHYLSEADPTRRDYVLNVLENGSVDRTGRVRELLVESDSIDYSMSVARERLESACGNLEVLAPSAARDCLAAVTDFALRRQR